jgi:hypothetical protein
VEGELTLQPDGNWKGEGDASTNMVEEMKGLGTECPAKRFKSKQRLRLVARKVDGFSSNAQSISNQSGTPDAGYLALEVKPDRAPILDPTGDPEDPCFPDMYQSGEYGALPLLPLNDARWTQPPYGYIIGLPQSGVLEYDDLTIGNVFPPQEEANPSPIVADSKWKVRVERL